MILVSNSNFFYSLSKDKDIEDANSRIGELTEKLQSLNKELKVFLLSLRYIIILYLIFYALNLAFKIFIFYIDLFQFFTKASSPKRGEAI